MATEEEVAAAAEEKAATEAKAAEETKAAEEAEATAKAEADAKEEKEAAAKAAGEVDWRDSVGDDFKKDAEQYSSIDEILNRTRKTRQLLSKAIIPPGEDASEDDIANYRRKIGVPESAEKYEVTRPKELPDALSSEVALANEVAIATKAHELNISTTQLAGLMDTYWQVNTDMLDAIEVERERVVKESEVALKKEWGSDFDRNKEFANSFLRNIFDDPEAALQIKLDTGQFLLDDPIMVKAFTAAGRAMGEDGIGPVLGSGKGEEIQTQIDALTEKQHDSTKIFSQKDSARLQELYEILYPDTKDVTRTGSPSSTMVI